MIGSLIGGAVGAIGSIFGGVKASQAMKKVKANVESQKQANEDWMNRRYNENVTTNIPHTKTMVSRIIARFFCFHLLPIPAISAPATEAAVSGKSGTNRLPASP